MKEYEEKKYAQWRENLEATLMTYLKRNLLLKVVATPASVKQLTLGDEEKTSVDEGDGNASIATAMQGKIFSFLVKSYKVFILW